MPSKTLTVKLTSAQIRDIVERVVPLIAEPQDHEFFRGVIGLKLEECATSAAVAAFVSKLLRY